MSAEMFRLGYPDWQEFAKHVDPRFSLPLLAAGGRVGGIGMRVVILGATSAIAEATARLYAAAGATILLVGRNDARLSDMASDLRERGARLVKTAVCDLVSEPDVMARLEEFAALAGGIDHLLIAYGVLGSQEEAENDPAAAETVLRVNFNSVARVEPCRGRLFRARASRNASRDRVGRRGSRTGARTMCTVPRKREPRCLSKALRTALPIPGRARSWSSPGRRIRR